jgi:hypothetical protein
MEKARDGIFTAFAAMMGIVIGEMLRFAIVGKPGVFTQLLAYIIDCTR